MPATKKIRKDDVLNLRTTPEQKSTLEKAAERLGISTAAFILENSLKAARRELSSIQELSLAKRDAEIFLAALENPSGPNPALKKAFQKYDAEYGI